MVCRGPPHRRRRIRGSTEPPQLPARVRAERPTSRFFLQLPGGCHDELSENHQKARSRQLRARHSPAPRPHTCGVTTVHHRTNRSYRTRAHHHSSTGSLPRTGSSSRGRRSRRRSQATRRADDFGAVVPTAPVGQRKRSSLPFPIRNLEAGKCHDSPRLIFARV